MFAAGREAEGKLRATNARIASADAALAARDAQMAALQARLAELPALPQPPPRPTLRMRMLGHRATPPPPQGVLCLLLVFLFNDATLASAPPRLRVKLFLLFLLSSCLATLRLHPLSYHATSPDVVSA